MGHDFEFSDYGSGNTSDCSTMSWGGQDGLSLPHRQEIRPKPKANSFVDLMMGRCTIEDVMKEFKMNGSDSPYNPDDDRVWTQPADDLTGLGPSSAYLRQKSWPAPERTPVLRLPVAPMEVSPPPSPEVFPAEVCPPSPPAEALTEEQLRVLWSLPGGVLHSLLRGLQGRGDAPAKGKRPEECRFCKNNGERASYYRSHALKDGGGRVRCPVLRAFVCRRCGARGDHAHTIKYCPLTSNDERIKSAAMMRSVRLAAGRRRALEPPGAHYVVFGAASAAVLRDDSELHALAGAAPLDPLWAALEQKLML